jgi:hypothetical protein
MDRAMTDRSSYPTTRLGSENTAAADELVNYPQSRDGGQRSFTFHFHSCFMIVTVGSLDSRLDVS